MALLPITFADALSKLPLITKTAEGAKTLTDAHQAFAPTTLNQNGTLSLGIIMDAASHTDPSVIMKIGWEISPDGKQWSEWFMSSRPGGPCIDGDSDLRYFHSFDELTLKMEAPIFIRPFIETIGGTVSYSDFQWWVKWR